MKSAKMACVHPAALQLFQKLVESTLGSGCDGGLADAAGAGEMAELERRGELRMLRGFKRSGEGDGPAELRRETTG